jgi:hypothetical protein
VLALLVALTLVSTFVALRRGRTGLGSGVMLLAIATALLIPIYALLVVESPVHVHDPKLPQVAISPWGLRCLVIATIVGGFALLSFTAALLRAVPVSHPSSWCGSRHCGRRLGRPHPSSFVRRTSFSTCSSGTCCRSLHLQFSAASLRRGRYDLDCTCGCRTADQDQAPVRSRQCVLLGPPACIFDST